MPFHGILSNIGQFITTESHVQRLDNLWITQMLISSPAHFPNITTPSLSKVAKEPGIKGK